MSTASSHPTAGADEFSPHRAESRTAPPPGGGVRGDQWAGFARNSSGQIMGIAVPIPLSSVTGTVSISSQRSTRRGTSGGGGGSGITRAQSPLSQAAGAAPEWKELVREAASLIACFQRLHATNEGVCFWNVDRTLKLMLRNNPDSSANTLSAELLLLCDDDDDDDGSATKELEEIMELDVDSYVDGDAWVLEEFLLDASVEPTDDAVTGVMETINKVYNMRICDCRKYMLREQDTSTCCFCLLTGTAADREPVNCPICYAVGPRLGFRKQECCGQLMHTSCLNRWHATSANTCPWCRHDPTAVAAQDAPL